MIASARVRGTATWAVLLIILIALSACSAERPSSSTPSPDEASGSSTRPLCERQPLVRDGADFCRSVEVEGKPYRYGFKPASGEPTASTIVVDMGGPGVSPLAREGLGRIIGGLDPSLVKSNNVVLVEEPWVTAEMSDGCDNALSDFHTNLRSVSATTELGDLLARCDLDADEARWGFGRDAFGDVLTAIERKHDIRVTGFIGASFGSVRWATSNPDRYEWVVILRPFPVGATGAELLEARAAVIDEAAPVSAYPTVPPEGTALPSRSAPVSPLDVVSARVAAGRSAEPPQDLAGVAHLSDGFWQRYGRDSLSPALLAYWQEVCAATGPWGASTWDGTAEDVNGFLASFHAPCNGMKVDAMPEPTPSSVDPERTCVVVSDLDSVTPAALSRPIFERLGTHVVESGVAAHESLDGLEACIEKVVR